MAELTISIGMFGDKVVIGDPSFLTFLATWLFLALVGNGPCYFERV